MSLVRWKKGEISTTGGRPFETTLAAVESLALPLVQEVVFLADFKCPKCQQRVAEVMAKMNGETQSVVISVLEKKVTLICTYPVINKPAGRRLARRTSTLGHHPAIKLGSHQSSMLAEVHCMEMRINLDCNACCRKMRRILLRMKEIEKYMIEKQQQKVTVWGRFVPADVAIKIRKKMNRRVEILEIQVLGNVDGQVDQMPPVLG